MYFSTSSGDCKNSFVPELISESSRIIDERHGIWGCHFAGSCSQVCPKGVDPAMGIQLLRGYLLGYRK